METILIYILKSTLYLSLFYAGYKLLLAEETFFGFNRSVLLLGICLSLVIPAIEVERNIPLFYDQYFATTELTHNAAATNQIEIPANTTIANEISDNTTTPTIVATTNTSDTRAISIPWIAIIAAIYLLGCIINIVMLANSYRKMLRLIKTAQPHTYAGIDYRVTTEHIAPFCWKNTIVVPEKDLDNIHEILAHEKAHIQRNHYRDILLSELALIIHWFNPLAWKLKNELKDIHEYQADSQAISNGIDAQNYQLIILKKAVGPSSYALANSFNHSKIKKRITMMLKRKSKSLNQLKAVFLILFSGIFIYACSNSSNNSKEKNANEQEIATLNKNNATEPKEAKKNFANPIDMSKITNKTTKAETRIQEPTRIDDNAEIWNNLKITNIYFSAPENTPVYAVLPGTLRTFKSSAQGHRIYIEHENGLKTIYEQCEAILPNKTQVKQGEQIGFITQKGMSAESKRSKLSSALIFSVEKDDHTFNPEKIFDFDNQELRVAPEDIDKSDESLEPLPILKSTIKFTPPVIKKDTSNLPPPPPPMKSTKKSEVIENKDKKS